MHPWARLVYHDLVKRFLWTARDCHALGQQAAPGELRPNLVDEAGAPIQAEALWQKLKVQAPAGADVAAFESALLLALGASERDDVEGVLALQLAFDQLCETVDSGKATLAPTLNTGDT